MRPYSMGSINALVKHGGAAALKDTASQASIKKMVIDCRKKTHRRARRRYGYETIPSETNFFMVAHRPRDAAGDRGVPAKKVLVGRPFPPMTTHMRVSVGTADEMAPVHDRVQGDLPGKDANTARRLENYRILNSEF